ncbi:hypothetical protein BEN49_19660 [Hymenobacter coccineus]|uniref:Uncharacterized protein n=2 Tax=Hymenobacter coccineus TaxID=1908235 RepID=A0A1G1TKQ8_9BACT|nr:hypothetical protein BEN49_19660 [Hymenobacter coccineus]
MIMSPEGVKRIVSAGEQLNSDFIARWAYLFKFDYRGRKTSKKAPGKAWEYTVYDRWDRPVATQDGNERKQGKWEFAKYDELNRIIITGQINIARTGEQLTADIESAVAAGTIGRYESSNDNATATVRIGYTLTKSWPATAAGTDLYTVNYFDNYSFLNASQDRLRYKQEASSDLSSPNAASTLTVGFPTIIQTRILGSNNWLIAVTYYNDKARILQTTKENQLGNVDRVTTEYDYPGKIIKTYTAHNVTASGPTHTILYRYTYYDDGSPNELFAWFNKKDGAAEILLSKKEYNELGQLVDEKLGFNPASGKYLQSIDYRYNTKGQPSCLNNRDLQDGVTTNDDLDAEPDLFGLELKYDTDLQTGSTAACYNGNIAESLWKSRRDNKLRSFAYRYDNANRIIDAKYAAYNSGWTDEKDDVGINGSASSIGRFTTSDIKYDLNGNILQMNRVGRRTISAGGLPIYGPIDQLRYNYGSAGGNQLRSVVDQAGRSDAPNDFEDVTSSGEEYTYDANGNMASDANKSLSVSYNELDLPSQVKVGATASTSFTYSATGEKFSQIHSGGSTNSQITYVNGFVYTTVPGPALSVATPTGRALYGTTPDNATRRWIQEYHIRDHLGNLRIAFRDEGQAPVQRMAATMEAVNAEKETKTFDNLNATRQFDPNHAHTGSYAARLNAGQVQRMYGPSASVQVHAGDSLHFEAYGRYDVLKKAGVWPALLPVAVAANTDAPSATRDGQAVPRRSLIPRLAAGLTLTWAAIPHLFQRPEKVPRASIKYDFYDKDSVLVASEVKYLEHDAANAWQQLVVGFKAKEDGYVVASAQNGSPKDVWLDDFTLRTTTVAMIVQENHYDPWGQNLVDIEVAGTPDCKQQYGNQERLDDDGLEWVDHGARYYDSQLGRWHVPDPADQFSSPYLAMGNNPVVHTDPDGKIIPLLVIGGAALVGGIINVAAHWGKINSSPHGFRDGLVAFGIGAAAGTLSAVTGGAAAGAVATAYGAGAAATIGGGAIIGAVGAAYGSILGGIGNTAYFQDPYSLKQMLYDTAIGAAAGGLINGAVKGVNYLKGRWAPSPLGEAPLQTASPPSDASPLSDDQIAKLENGETIFDGAVDDAGNQMNSFAGNKAGDVASSSARRVGVQLETIQDVYANPELLRGRSPSEIKDLLGDTPGWRVETLGKGSQAGRGMVIKQYLPNGNPSGKLIQWHPGGGHHGPLPYWKVKGIPNLPNSPEIF